jgi:hypothetical protein
MTFDLTIRSSRAYSRSVPLEPLSRFIASLPHVKTVRPELLVFEVPPDRHMEISLETATRDGDSDAPSEAGGWRVNCIRLHIPYAFMGDPAERDYYRLAEMLTTLLGWMLYDQQTGRYVRLYPCAYSRQKTFDRLVLGASGKSDTVSAGGRAARSPHRGRASGSRGAGKGARGKTKSTRRKRRDA